MEEFVTCSKQLWHPFDELRNLPDGLIRCTFKTLTSGMAEVTRHRIEKLTEWSELAKSLSRDEEKLHQTLDPNVAAILKGKRLLLLERLAEQISWPDKSIHKELKSGFMLTGYAPPSGIFKPELRPASLDKAQLMADSKYIRPLILSKLAQRDRSGDVPEKERDDEKLFEITLTEAHQKHWLQGPFTPEQIASRHEGVWLPVRRFGVWQKEKLRPIDDMKENKLNDCFSCSDKIDLHALDHVLWSLCVCIRFCLYSGDLDFKLSDGSRLHGSVRESWTRAGAHFSMTSFDLASAYKQLPLNPKEYNCSVVTLRNPKENSVACFEMRTLPFGSVASVLHFNRVARLIWALGLQLGIIWGNYFDDYPVITHDLHKASTMTCVKNLFGLLGFDFAEDKLAPFAKSAETLGVIVNLTDTTSGRVVVDNKDSRKAELSETIQTILSNDALVPAQLPSVLGWMQFADVQLAGRMGGLAMADLRSLGHDSKTKVSLPTSIRQSLEVLNQRFAKGKPRTLRVTEPSRPVLIFTDGAFEMSETGDPIATIGGVLLRPEQKPKVFGCKVHHALLDRWLESSTHPIGLVELYAVVVAFELWMPEFTRDKVIFFCDNWTTIDVFVRSYSVIEDWRNLLVCLEKLDSQAEAMLWIARVASQSNVADPPSRGSLDTLTFLGDCQLDQPVCSVMHETLVPLF